LQFPGATRVFHLCEAGIACDGAGLRVGGVDLLEPDPVRARGWRARPDADLNLELSARYRLPVDVVGKSHGLNRIADALERGDLALAQIGALLLQMPDPPALGKALGGDDAWDLAMQLAASGLLKADWDETKHPRTGTPPNPGWFAPTEQDPNAVTTDQPKLKTGWPSRLINTEARKWAAEFASKLIDVAEIGVRATLIAEGILTFLKAYRSTELNVGEDRLNDQMYASLNQPKTLEELQTRPVEYNFGYERHHIVEQNPDNVAKISSEIEIDKFGRDTIDEDANIVWIPRFKHELITSEYNSKDEDDPGGRIRRKVVNDMDYEQQRDAGLGALREYGVLK